MRPDVALVHVISPDLHSPLKEVADQPTRWHQLAEIIFSIEAHCSDIV